MANWKSVDSQLLVPFEHGGSGRMLGQLVPGGLAGGAGGGGEGDGGGGEGTGGGGDGGGDSQLVPGYGSPNLAHVCSQYRFATQSAAALHAVWMLLTVIAEQSEPSWVRKGAGMSGQLMAALSNLWPSLRRCQAGAGPGLSAVE